MSEQEINIKIAEYCGWQYLDTGGTPIWYHPNSTLLTMPDGTQGDGLIDPPDYCNDLNACHEMEKSLTKLQKNQYSGKLMEKYTYALFTTARQRAEAFLKTIEE